MADTNSIPAQPFMIFWSWQRDLGTKDNRNFIESALRKAMATVQSETHEALDIWIAARGEPGAPDIASTIFERIRRCDALVADVSIVGRGNEPTRRHLSNPNVLVEAGFAAKAVGWHRLILVHNLQTGRIEDLPFDLRGRLIVDYNPAMPNRDAAKKSLISKLEVALRAVLQHGKISRGATWIDDGERDYRLAAAAFDLDDYARIAGEWRRGLEPADCLSFHSELSISLPSELFMTDNLRRCLEIAWLEIHREDAAFLHMFLRIVEAFNRAAMRLPVGRHADSGPTMKGLLQALPAIQEHGKLVLRILEHAREHGRPEDGKPTPKAPGERPYDYDPDEPSATVVVPHSRWPPT